MDLPRKPRQSPRENIIPMINVVFLLLIFFLMTAQIAPPEPFEVTPPESTAETPAEKGITLFVSAEGELALNDLRGEPAIIADLQAREPGFDLTLRADARVGAEKIAALLLQLAGAGVHTVKLISSQR